MRKMVVEMPDELFKALKMRAAELDTTLKVLVAMAVRQFLTKGGEKQ